MNSKKVTRGFTLIEILVVIGIISVLLTFAIPQMLRSRMNANELAAITALRTISNACQCYYNDVTPHTYPPDLAGLTTPNVTPPYINSTLAAAIDIAHTRQGYYFTYNLVDSEHFTLVAWPKSFGRTGGRNFFVNELGNITYTTENGLTPDENAQPVE